MKIIKNFVEPNVFRHMKDLVFSHSFPYFYVPTVGSVRDRSDFMFQHLLFFDNKQNSDHFNLLMSPLLGRLDFNFLQKNQHYSAYNSILTSHHYPTMMFKNMEIFMKI